MTRADIASVEDIVKTIDEFVKASEFPANGTPKQRADWYWRHARGTCISPGDYARMMADPRITVDPAADGPRVHGLKVIADPLVPDDVMVFIDHGGNVLGSVDFRE